MGKDQDYGNKHILILQAKMLWVIFKISNYHYENYQGIKGTGKHCLTKFMPGTRLELVTRGFSVLCSTN